MHSCISMKCVACVIFVSMITLLLLLACAAFAEVSVVACSSCSVMTQSDRYIELINVKLNMNLCSTRDVQ